MSWVLILTRSQIKSKRITWERITLCIGTLNICSMVVNWPDSASDAPKIGFNAAGLCKSKQRGKLNIRKDAVNKILAPKEQLPVTGCAALITIYVKIVQWVSTVIFSCASMCKYSQRQHHKYVQSKCSSNSSWLIEDQQLNHFDCSLVTFTHLPQMQHCRKGVYPS